MKLVITEAEARSIAGYFDTYITAMNVIGSEIEGPDFKGEPVEGLKLLEAWFNCQVTNNLVDKKVVKISVIPLINNILISVDSDFIVDFMTLYSDILNAIVPPATNIIKAVYQIASVGKSFQERGEAFAAKWLPSEVIEDVTDQVTDQSTIDVV
jgi:hypothetical protein